MKIDVSEDVKRINDELVMSVAEEALSAEDSTRMEAALVGNLAFLKYLAQGLHTMQEMDVRPVDLFAAVVSFGMYLERRLIALRAEEAQKKEAA